MPWRCSCDKEKKLACLPHFHHSFRYQEFHPVFLFFLLFLQTLNAEHWMLNMCLVQCINYPDSWFVFIWQSFFALFLYRFAAILCLMHSGCDSDIIISIWTSNACQTHFTSSNQIISLFDKTQEVLCFGAENSKLGSIQASYPSLVVLVPLRKAKTKT